MEPEALEQAGGRPGLPLLSIFWRRKALVVLGVVAGLVLGGLYYAQRQPVYESSAQVLVIKKTQEALPIPGSDAAWSYYEDYLATHMKLIQSPEIVGRAAKKKEVLALATLAGHGDATATILGGLTTARDKDPAASSSNIFNLSFRGPVAEDCVVIVNAVIDSYKEFLEEKYRNVSKKTEELIKKAGKTLRTELEIKEEEYRRFREKCPPLWRAKEGPDPQKGRLATVEGQIINLKVRKAEIKNRLEEIEEALKKGRSRTELLALIPAQKEKEEKEDRSLHQQLGNLLVQKQLLLVDFGKDHPQVLALTRQIELLESLMAGEIPDSKGKGNTKPKRLRKPAADPIQVYLRALRYELMEIDGSYRVLAEFQKREQKKIEELDKYEVQDEAFRNAIGQKTRFYDSLMKRLEEINIVRDLGGFDAQTIHPPGVGNKVAPKLAQFLAGGWVLGMLVGAGLAFLAEVTDKSFRTPEEIRRRLGLPIVGHIWHLAPARETVPNGATGLDPILCTYFQPKSVEAEAYRSLRTALYFSTSGKGHQVIQITSPGMGDGKTTLAANLAISIAQSGKRVLLIDADFRRPRLHRTFGLAGGVGLASVIIGEAVLRTAILETPVPGLAVLPCGPIPPNPAELLTSPRFKELLDTIREGFDFVVIDTPPLLAVTDPCVVAPRVDGIYLTLRLSKNGRPQAERAKEILTTLGAKVLGVVVNDIPKKSGGGGYGYGHYQYGYSQGYSYAEPEEAPTANGVPTQEKVEES
jgi:capsular exopolysaccharide synthesis family protein